MSVSRQAGSGLVKYGAGGGLSIIISHIRSTEKKFVLFAMMHSKLLLNFKIVAQCVLACGEDQLVVHWQSTHVL